MTARVPVRARDALFRYAQAPLLCQQAGAALLPGSAAVQPRDFRHAMAQRVQRVPELRRRLERPRSAWQRSCWVTGEDLDIGCCTAWPVNSWLIRVGIKEAM